MPEPYSLNPKPETLNAGDAGGNKHGARLYAFAHAAAVLQHGHT